MSEARAVGKGQALNQLTEDGEAAPIPEAPLGAQNGVEGAARGRADEIRQARVLARGDERHNLRVNQPGRGGGLRSEARDSLRPGRQVAVEQGQGEGPARAGAGDRIAQAVAHATRRAADDVRADSVAGLVVLAHGRQV